MELNEYQNRVKALQAQAKALWEREKALHREYAEQHEWNTYKGKKVRIVNTITDERSAWGYMVSVEPNATSCEVGCILCHNVKADGSEGKKEIRLYCNWFAARIEVE